MFIINYYLVINIVSFVVVIMVNLPPILKVYGGLRFWLKRLVERLDMIYVRVLVCPVVQG